MTGARTVAMTGATTGTTGATGGSDEREGPGPVTGALDQIARGRSDDRVDAVRRDEQRDARDDAGERLPSVTPRRSQRGADESHVQPPSPAASASP
jgi:hypothetical protein